MRILPVLDILDRQVVHAKAGRRDEYRPIESRLIAGSDPLELAREIRNTYGLNAFYLADLDGILRRRPNLSLYQLLVQAGFELLVDSGLRSSWDAVSIQNAGVDRIVVGLETCDSPDDLAEIVQSSIEVTFGLDLLHGIPRRPANSGGWSDDPLAIIRQALSIGCHDIGTKQAITSILPLDLSDVGMSTGGSTHAICRFIRDEFPHTRLITGGGVRSRADLLRLRDLGVDEVLVASALHDGRLTPADLMI